MNSIVPDCPQVALAQAPEDTVNARVVNGAGMKLKSACPPFAHLSMYAQGHRAHGRTFARAAAAGQRRWHPAS